MPGKAAKVTITERQQVGLEELSRSRSESQMISQRARIILRAFAGGRNEDIALEVGLERKQVGLWRRRWQQAWEPLTLLECTQPWRLREAIRDTPRSGAPGIFTAEQIIQILAVACEDPALSERPITHWTGTAGGSPPAWDCRIDLRLPHRPLSAGSGSATAPPEDVAEHEGEESRSVRATNPDRV